MVIGAAGAAAAAVIFVARVWSDDLMFELLNAHHFLTFLQDVRFRAAVQR